MDRFTYRDGNEGRVGEAVSQIGWTRDYIIVNASYGDNRWMIIRIADNQVLAGTERAVVEKKLLKSLHLMTPQEAWKRLEKQH